MEYKLIEQPQERDPFVRFEIEVESSGFDSKNKASIRINGIL